MANEPKVTWEYGGRGGLFPPHRVKRGYFIGKIKHTKQHWEKYRAVQMALVQFNGNKTVTQVPFHELKFVEETEK